MDRLHAFLYKPLISWTVLDSLVCIGLVIVIFIMMRLLVAFVEALGDDDDVEL